MNLCQEDITQISFLEGINQLSFQVGINHIWIRGEVLDQMRRQGDIDLIFLALYHLGDHPKFKLFFL